MHKETNPNEQLTGTPIVNQNWSEPFLEYRANGLTKREYFAAMAMQGLIASNYSDTGGNCKVAVQHADELIKALNTKP